MNIGEKSNQQSEEYIINTIKNISQQLYSINPSNNKKSSTKQLDNSQKINQLKHSIEELVGGLEENHSSSASAYNAVSSVKDNDTLVISERDGKVFLPYTVSELEAYMEEFPNEYKSLSDVINQEYIVSTDRFKNQVTSRFRETYCLMRDVEMKSIIESFRKAVEVMFKSKLNPIIICACKSEEQLRKYIYCAEHECLEKFKGFKIIFEVNPLYSKYNNFEETLLRNTKKRNRGKHSK